MCERKSVFVLACVVTVLELTLKGKPVKQADCVESLSQLQHLHLAAMSPGLFDTSGFTSDGAILEGYISDCF